MTVILEDVTTTGDSLLTTIDSLNSLTKTKIQIIAAFGLTNRMELRDDGQSVQQAVESRKVPYHALSNTLQLLPEAYRRLKPGEQIAKAIEDELKNTGLKNLG